MSTKQCEWLSHARSAPFPFPLFLFPEFYFPIFPILWDLEIPACVLSALFAFDISAPMSTFYYDLVFILCIMFYLTFSIYPFKFCMYQGYIYNGRKPFSPRHNCKKYFLYKFEIQNTLLLLLYYYYHYKLCKCYLFPIKVSFPSRVPLDTVAPELL